MRKEGLAESWLENAFLVQEHLRRYGCGKDSVVRVPDAVGAGQQSSQSTGCMREDTGIGAREVS